MNTFRLSGLVFLSLLAFSGPAPQDPPKAPTTIPIGIELSAAAKSALKVVRIENQDGGGSGVPIARVGNKVLILTAKHVTHDLKNFMVHSHDGKLFVVLSPVTEHPTEDFSLFWVDAPGLDPIGIAPGSMLGQKLMSSGYPMGQGIHLTEGYLGGEAFGLRLMSAPIIYGMSGGPVVDELGRLVGINRAMARDPSGAALTMMSMLAEVVPVQDWIARILVDTLPK